MISDDTLESLQKVIISMVFYGDRVTISVSKDKTVEFVSQTAYQFFQPQGKIKLFHKNKDLSPYIYQKLADQFPGETKIDILVKDTAKKDDGKADSKKNAEQNTNALPASQKAMNYCWDCKEKQINIFCRDCCAFICTDCQNNKSNSHYGHRTVTLYPENLALSANIYKNILLEDLNDAMNGKGEKFEKDEVIDIESYKNKLLEKLNKLSKKIKQIKEYQKKVDFYINNKDDCKKKLETSLKKIKDINNEYLKKDSSGKKNDGKKNVGKKNEGKKEENKDEGKKDEGTDNIIDRSNLKEAFGKLNLVDKETRNICLVGQTLKDWEEINNKLVIALNTVENKITSVINESIDKEEDAK